MSSSAAPDPYVAQSRSELHSHQVEQSQHGQPTNYHWRMDAHRMVRQLMDHLHVPFYRVFQRMEDVLDTRMPWTFDEPILVAAPRLTLFARGDETAQLIVAHGAMWVRDMELIKSSRPYEACLPQHLDGVLTVKNEGAGHGGHYDSVDWLFCGTRDNFRLSDHVSSDSNLPNLAWSKSSLWKVVVTSDHHPAGARFFGAATDAPVYVLFVPFTAQERKIERQNYNVSRARNLEAALNAQTASRPQETSSRRRLSAALSFSSSSKDKRAKEAVNSQDLKLLLHVFASDYGMESKVEAVELVSALLRAVDIDGMADVGGVRLSRAWTCEWGKEKQQKQWLFVRDARVFRAVSMSTMSATLGVEYTIPVGEHQEQQRFYLRDSELRADYYGSINMRRDPRTWRDGWQTVERPAAIWLVYGAQSLFKHIKMKPQDGLHVVFLADKDMDIPVHR